MSIDSQFVREENAIWEAEARGEISNKEAWEQQRELQRDLVAAAQESAQQAYEDEYARW